MSECTHNNLDNLSFEGIFMLHHLRVYVLCLRMTGSVAEAEELTQEVFVHVSRNLETFRGDTAFSTRLYRLTVNRVLMHFRRNRVRKEQTTEEDELPAVPGSGGTSKSRLHKARMKMRRLLTRRITPPAKIDGVIGPDPVNCD
jgi:RNA polymerase sigma factor (sigma-70 family)